MRITFSGAGMMGRSAIQRLKTSGMRDIFCAPKKEGIIFKQTIGWPIGFSLRRNGCCWLSADRDDARNNNSVEQFKQLSFSGPNSAPVKDSQ